MALIGSAFFPAASMIFFVVPFVGHDRAHATYATASMVTFVAGLVLMSVSLVPVLVIAAYCTEATLSAGAFLAAAVVVAAAAVPFTLMGLAIGYSLSAKAAIVLAQVLFFPLAFGGGLMTGAAAHLMWAAVGDFPFRPGSLAALAAWTAALAGVAVWAYRRDEGRRFS